MIYLVTLPVLAALVAAAIFGLVFWSVLEDLFGALDREYANQLNRDPDYRRRRRAQKDPVKRVVRQAQKRILWALRRPHRVPGWAYRLAAKLVHRAAYRWSRSGRQTAKSLRKAHRRAKRRSVSMLRSVKSIGPSKSRPTGQRVSGLVDGKAPARLRILVCLHTWYYFKNLSTVFEQLLEDGHELKIVALIEDREDFTRSVEEFQRRHAALVIDMGPTRKDGWQLMCWGLRQTIGFLHFQDARFDGMPRLRGRMSKRAAREVQRLMGKPAYRKGWRRAMVTWLTRRLETAIPADPGITAYVRDYNPDVVIVTPLIDLDGAQWDYLKSAKKLGIPSVFPVYSWDNLSSKTHLFELPDRVLVWNQRQVEEASRYHHTPRSRIRVTGAQSFDEWFDRKPSVDRAAFCRSLGLDPAKPTILYVGSATTRRDMTEAQFTQRWLKALRGAESARLREANVVIRPHPKRERIWAGLDLEAFGPLVVHPAQGQLPIGEEAKRVYFDSLHHCDVVVGLNTSALIEAGIVGRPVFTVLDEDFAVDQTETFHFHYLLHASEGLLSVARTFDEHLGQIADALEDPERLRARAKAFVRSFVRPYGESVAATPLFAQEVLGAAQLKRRKRRAGWLDRLLRWRMDLFVFDEKCLRFQAGKLKKRMLAKHRRQPANGRGAEPAGLQRQPAE